MEFWQALNNPGLEYPGEAETQSRAEALDFAMTQLLNGYKVCMVEFTLSGIKHWRVHVGAAGILNTSCKVLSCWPK